jgi:hypothetical protein
MSTEEIEILIDRLNSNKEKCRICKRYVDFYYMIDNVRKNESYICSKCYNLYKSYIKKK